METPWIIITIVSLMCSALFSGTEIAYITADRVRTQIDVKHGGVLGTIIRRFYSNSEFFISSILVGNNIMLVIYGRMIEVYLTTSIGPIPLATMTNRDWSHTGQNYLKSLFALAFQAFLIMVCVGIYSVLVQTISTSGDLSGAIWACMGYTVLLCFALFKTGSLSKSLFGAH